MPAKPPKPSKKRKARKQTSDRVSRIAAKVLRVMRDDSLTFHVGSETVTTREIRTLAASCLSQDEVKGKRGRKVGR